MGRCQRYGRSTPVLGAVQTVEKYLVASSHMFLTSLLPLLKYENSEVGKVQLQDTDNHTQHNTISTKPIQYTHYISFQHNDVG